MTVVSSPKAREQCGAKTRNGGTCRQRAGQGTEHVGFGNCRLHGGASPNGIKHAQKAQATFAAAAFALPREIDPHTALMEELHRTAGIVGWYETEIRALEVAKLHVAVGGGQGGVPEQKMHVYIGALHQERRHLKDVAETCIRVGIDERRVEIAGQQGQLFGQVMQNILRRLNVLDLPGTPEVVRQELTAAAGLA